MMGSDFYFRDKIPVAILGATGCVGQKFIQVLAHHPWFEIAHLCASERSVGKPYGEVVNWLMTTPLPESVANMVVKPCEPLEGCTLAFSALDNKVAGEVEISFAQAGFIVVSNCRHHRLHKDVPLVVGEVNPDHLQLIDHQSYSGKIVTNPNCAVIGLVLALKPLMDRFGVEELQVVTLQAISGAGYPGVASLDICDNVIPYIEGEEAKIEREPLKILGQLKSDHVQEAKIKISAQCHRVPVTEGHLASVFMKLKEKPTVEQIIEAWSQFTGEPQLMQLPTAPFSPLHYLQKPYYPQPRLHRSLDKEMAVSLGHLRPCPIFGYKFNLLSHNTMRGAVGSALLNAELLVKYGKIYW